MAAIDPSRCDILITCVDGVFRATLPDGLGDLCSVQLRDLEERYRRIAGPCEFIYDEGSCAAALREARGYDTGGANEPGRLG